MWPGLHHNNHHQRRPMKAYELVQQHEGGGDEEGEAVQRRPAPTSRLPWLPLAITAICSLLLMFFFGTPSTLFVYLPFLFVYSIAGVVCLAARLLVKQRRLPFTPSMGVAIVLVSVSLLASHLSLTPAVRMPTRSPPPPEGVLFVAANLYNSEAILPRFTASIFELAEAVQRDKLFVSIYESNSEDSTKLILSRFGDEMTRRGIAHHIEVTDSHNHIGVQGDNDRIRFLANVRNKVYNVLDDTEAGRKVKPLIKRVLWLNDIVFDSRAALELLNTNEARYDVACGLDFVPLGLYDTWVTRDLSLKRLKPLWPYFEDTADVERLRRGELIPVSSCWNGIAAFNADWLLDGRPQPFSSNVSDPPSSATWPLRFRASERCLSSECLLINYDMHLLLAHQRRPEIYVNPLVRVGECTPRETEAPLLAR